MVFKLAVGTVTLALGIFATISPSQAAKIWGWKNLDRLAPHARTSYLRCYRTSGVLLCLAGILLAAEKIWAVN